MLMECSRWLVLFESAEPVKGARLSYEWNHEHGKDANAAEHDEHNGGRL